MFAILGSREMSRKVASLRDGAGLMPFLEAESAMDAARVQGVL